MPTTLCFGLSSSGQPFVKKTFRLTLKQYKILQDNIMARGYLRRKGRDLSARVEAVQDSGFDLAQLNVETAAVGFHGAETDGPALVLADPLDQ